jgi:hypothetical protein
LSATGASGTLFAPSKMKSERSRKQVGQRYLQPRVIRIDFERPVREVLGPSGFTRFLTIDHGDWVSKQERPTRFLMYTIG